VLARPVVVMNRRLRLLVRRARAGRPFRGRARQWERRGADQAITSAIDSHVQAEQHLHPDEDFGQASALAPVG